MRKEVPGQIGQLRIDAFETVFMIPGVKSEHGYFGRQYVYLPVDTGGTIMSIFSYSTDADENTHVGGVFIGEHCPAKNLNDATRAVMADIATDVAPKITELSGKIGDINAALDAIIGEGA